MSQHTISRSPDLLRLQNEGYQVALVEGALVVDGIPYKEGESVEYGSLVCTLETDGDQATPPGDHTVFWTGSKPDGTDIGVQVEGRDCTAGVCDPPQEMGKRSVRFQLSIKPACGAYRDYYEKITAYGELLSRGAKKVASEASPREQRALQTAEEDNPFLYMDGTAEVRGTNAVGKPLREERIAIIGTGGTGAYILDFVAKSPVREIHLFDHDHLRAHNAYRVPGCASRDELRARPKKVEWLHDQYNKLRKGIHAHATRVREPVPEALKQATFVFLSMDKPEERGAIIQNLLERGIPFIYVGIQIRLFTREDGGIEAEPGMTCSLFAPEDGWTVEQAKNRINTGTVRAEDREAYGRNAQIAEINAMNAAMAVIQWKKYRKCYRDYSQARETIYEAGMQVMTRRRK